MGCYMGDLSVAYVSQFEVPNMGEHVHANQDFNAVQGGRRKCFTPIGNIAVPCVSARNSQFARF
jgi:hypothetical protein